MTPEEAYEEALRRIRKAKETGSRELDLGGLETLVAATHRKPMWLIPVSIICGWRAAGR